MTISFNLIFIPLFFSGLSGEHRRIFDYSAFPSFMTPEIRQIRLIASEAVIFGGLIACYILFRLRHPEWGAMASHTSTPLGAFNTFVLLTSSLTIALAHQAATERKLKKMGLMMGVTLLFGLTFLGVKAIEYSTEIHHGYTITSGLFWSFYYTMTGLHALHVIAGMSAIGLVWLGARHGQNLHRVEMAGLYWHLVDVVWIFLFPLLYIAQ